MKELQKLAVGLERDPKGGMLLPTAQLAQAFEDARPLDSRKLALLAQCLETCSEQIYEFYRPMVDLFRAEASAADEQTIQAGIRLGILDDEEWPHKGSDAQCS